MLSGASSGDGGHADGWKVRSYDSHPTPRCIHPRNCFHASPEYKAAHDRWRHATGNSFYHVARISQLDALTTSAWTPLQTGGEDGPMLFKRLASLGDSLAL